MPTTKMRVDIPKGAEDLIDLGEDIYKKHQTEGATSPLNQLVDYTWEVEGPKLSQAKEKHLEAESLKKKMEEAYRERDLLMTNTTQIIRASRDILTGINSANMKRLSEWGYDVTASTAPASKTAEKKTE
jgi:hypothetical protein